MPPGVFIDIEASVTAPPCQTMRSSATRRSPCTVRPISAITARTSCLRSRTVVVDASKMARMSAPAVVIQASSCSVNATGRRARWGSCPAGGVKGFGRRFPRRPAKSEEGAYVRVEPADRNLPGIVHNHRPNECDADLCYARAIK